MESEFSIYLGLGFDHILDINGYDHILFVIALCAIYQISEWKKVAILATSFTFGHSITLALSALDLVSVDSALIEFLIPLTILLTALYNVYNRRSSYVSISIKYSLAVFFGLIHGMGFSNFFRSAAIPGIDEGFITQLLAFNLGVELGQLIIIAFILGLTYVFLEIIKVKVREWNLFISGATAGLSIAMIIERIP
ncbi:MAG: HupE/UreJ family protein [Saprospiraceae bacterium]